MLLDYTEAILILSTTIFLVAILNFLWPVKDSRQSGGSQLPPGPRGLPLLGYLPFLSADLHREFTKLASLHGPIFKLYLGQTLSIVINSAPLVKEVLRDQDAMFANHSLTVATYVGSIGGNDIVFTPYGSEWKKLRKVFVREMLSKSILDNLYHLRREAIQNSIRRLYRKIGQPIEAFNLAFSTVADAVVSMLCGGSSAESMGMKGGKFSELAAELMVLLGKTNISDVFPAVARLDLQGIERETKRVMGVFEAMLESVIERKRRIKNEKKEERKDFLQFLLEIHEIEDSAESITMSQLKAMLMDIVIGGTDTTSTTVEWAISELLQNPEAMNKVLEELTQVVGLNNLVQESHLPQLTYLNAVIKETLRLHPPLPLLIPRYPSKCTTIGGYSVPEGTKIFLNIWAIQRDSNHWEAPLEFRPDRFLNKHNNGAENFDISGNNFNFIPLGSGRRVCAGIPLVERMLNYLLASLLHSFEWKLPADVNLDLSDRFGIVMKKKVPLVIIPAPRLCNLRLYA